MKTKIKFILLAVTISLCSGGVSELQAAWYGNHAVPYVAGSMTNCGPGDGDPTGGVGDTTHGLDYAVTNSMFSTSPSPAINSYVLNSLLTNATVVAPAGSMYCINWDASNPTATTPTYTNGWTNSATLTISWTASDAGGAGLMNYDINVYRIAGAQNTPTVANFLTTISAATTAPSLSYTYAPLDGYAYRFAVCPRDKALNTSPCVMGTSVARIDRTPPNPVNLSSTTAFNLLATNSQNFSFSYPNDGGSQIRITSQIEDFGNPAGYLTALNPSAYGWTFSSNQNIQTVDTDRNVDSFTARQYRYLVTSICDEAGNCNGTRTFDFNVYANPNSAAPINTPDTTDLANRVADGVQRNFVHTIRDEYNNAIIPTPPAGINRTVQMNLSGISNTMYLNQYSRSGGSSVFVDTNTTALATSGGQALGARTSSNGNYTLPLFVYTPTANGYASATGAVSDSAAAFSLSTNLVVNDTLIGAPKTFSLTLVNPAFKPRFETRIQGNLTDGLIEGADQYSNIAIVDNGGRTTSDFSSVQLQLAFSGSDSVNFTLSGGSAIGNMDTTDIAARSVIQSANPGFGITNLYTRLIQKPNTLVNNLNNLQFSTHYSYTLDGKSPIVYNSDIIGRVGGYWGTPATSAVGNQVGVKVIGPIASNVIQSIVTGQFVNGTSIFGGLSRADARNNIKQSVALATRNMIYSGRAGDISSVSGLPSSGASYSGSYIGKSGNTESILSIQKTGGSPITMALTSGISGKRTLVIKGANLYITSNMYYSTSDSILGVVVQKDEAGNGGNLYINPGVTNIVGTYVIDGSVTTSNNGTTPIGTSNIFTLRNQLYIYGSIVSENTIGGSRMSPYKCPSLVPSCTSVADAQQYDLNYLRRYYLVSSGSIYPFGSNSTSVIGSGTCNVSGACSGFDINLISKFTSTAEDLAKYPVIIEYNPNIRSNPPIGFETSKD